MSDAKVTPPAFSAVADAPPAGGDGPPVGEKARKERAKRRAAQKTETCPTCGRSKAVG